VAQFTYTDTVGRVYPNIAYDNATLLAVPGQTYELTADPGDGRWVSAVTTKSQDTAPVADSEPSTAPTDPTPSN